MTSLIKIKEEGEKTFSIEVNTHSVRFEIADEQPTSITFDLDSPEERQRLWRMISFFTPQLQLYWEK